MREDVLKINNLKAYYRVLKGDVKALDGVSFNLKRGEILGVPQAHGPRQDHVRRGHKYV